MSIPEGDARRHPRFSVDVEATARLPDGRKLRARTRDLSRTGICLIATQPFPVGVLLTIDLVLAFSDNAFSEPLNVEARVVWCTNIAGTYQVGAMFDELNEQQDGFLEMFLQYLDGTLTPRGAPQDDDEDDEGSPDDKDDPFR